MADSFNAIATFSVVGPSVPDDLTADISVRMIPGGVVGTTNYYDVGGLNAGKLTLTLFFALESDYTAFKVQVGVQGYLIYQEYLSPGVLCFLTSLKRVTRALGTANETICTAEFTLTA